MGTKIKIILAVLVVLVLVGGFLVVSYRAPTVGEIAHEPEGDPPLFISPAVDGMRIYRSHLLGFQISYPEHLTVREYGKANTSTIVFEDQKGEKGFQIFVVPYADTVVSEERLKMDIPSGVIKDPAEVVVGGATATAFWSTNMLFGETREVWFIRDGFLYEVTTYKDLDQWLAEIMKTWTFI